MKPLPNRRKATLELYDALERNELTMRQVCKRMRRIVGLSQASYANLVGISTQALMDFERGRGNPTLKTLEKIGRPFGVYVCFRHKTSHADS